MKNSVALFQQIEARLHRACLTVSTFEKATPRAFFSTWPAYRLDWFDAEIEGSQRSDAAITRGLIAPPKFVPTPREIDDALPALALLDGIERIVPTSFRTGGEAPERTAKKIRGVIRCRAFELWFGQHVAADDEQFAHLRGSWRTIGRRFRISHVTAVNYHHAGVAYALERFLECSAKAGVPIYNRLALRA